MRTVVVILAVQAVDGTKVVANASVNRSYDAAGLSGLLERLEKAIADLEAQNEPGEDATVARLPKELADKEVLRDRVRQAMADLGSQKRHKRINLTDPEARLMKGRQGIVAGYNAQAMVSPMETAGGAAGMVVTAVDVVDAANDNALLVPMVEQAEETTGTRVPMTLADAGYFAVSHLVLQRQFREGCGVMPAWRRGAWHGSVGPVRYCPAYPAATAATLQVRTVPGAAFPAPPGRPAAS